MVVHAVHCTGRVIINFWARGIKSNGTYWAVLCIRLYKVIQTFEPVDETLQRGHLNESYWTRISFSAICYALPYGSSIWACGWNPEVWPFKRKLLIRSFPYTMQHGSSFWVYGWNPKVERPFESRNWAIDPCFPVVLYSEGCFKL